MAALFHAGGVAGAAGHHLSVAADGIQLRGLFRGHLRHRRRDDGGGEGGRSQRLPEDTLHTSSQLKAYDSGTAALRTGRHRERKLRSVL